jgi:hypothetical protein
MITSINEFRKINENKNLKDPYYIDRHIRTQIKQFTDEYPQQNIYLMKFIEDNKNSDVITFNFLEEIKDGRSPKFNLESVSKLKDKILGNELYQIKIKDFRFVNQAEQESDYNTYINYYFDFSIEVVKNLIHLSENVIFTSPKPGMTNFTDIYVSTIPIPNKDNASIIEVEPFEQQKSYGEGSYEVDKVYVYKVPSSGIRDSFTIWHNDLPKVSQMGGDVWSIRYDEDKKDVFLPYPLENHKHKFPKAVYDIFASHK